jgi:hypothetical protein
VTHDQGPQTLFVGKLDGRAVGKWKGGRIIFEILELRFATDQQLASCGDLFNLRDQSDFFHKCFHQATQKGYKNLQGLSDNFSSCSPIYTFLIYPLFIQLKMTTLAHSSAAPSLEEGLAALTLLTGQGNYS